MCRLVLVVLLLPLAHYPPGPVMLVLPHSSGPQHCVILRLGLPPILLLQAAALSELFLSIVEKPLFSFCLCQQMWLIFAQKRPQAELGDLQRSPQGGGRVLVTVRPNLLAFVRAPDGAEGRPPMFS